MLLLSWTCRWCSQPKITCVQVTGKMVQQVKCSPWKFEDPSSDAQCSHNKTGPAALLSVCAEEEKTGTSQELAGQPTELNPLAPGSLRDPVSRKWVWEPLREMLKIDLWPPHTHMHTQSHTQHVNQLHICIHWSLSQPITLLLDPPCSEDLSTISELNSLPLYWY